MTEYIGGKLVWNGFNGSRIWIHLVKDGNNTLAVHPGGYFRYIAPAKYKVIAGRLHTRVS